VAGRLLQWLILAILAAMPPGCAARASPSPAEQSATAAAAIVEAHSDDAASKGVTGVWEGFILARPAVMRYITLTLVQQGNEVTGYYRCAYGNQICRNMNETGVIKDGKMIKRRLMMRVMLVDGSMCYFTGVPQGDELQGVYFCVHGVGGENGRFRTVRSY
jgi:hypothetical protein